MEFTSPDITINLLNTLEYTAFSLGVRTAATMDTCDTSCTHQNMDNCDKFEALNPDTVVSCQRFAVTASATSQRATSIAPKATRRGLRGSARIATLARCRDGRRIKRWRVYGAAAKGRLLTGIVLRPLATPLPRCA